MLCRTCGKHTDNPVFCSRSCAASFNNHKYGARHGNPGRVVCKCGSKKDSAAKQCNLCRRKETATNACKVPIKDFIGTSRNPAHMHNEVRRWGKKLMYLRGVEKKCLCGYTTHVECCHIHPVSGFDLNTPMGVVNSEQNLIYLCRNCHWELDNGYLVL